MVSHGNRKGHYRIELAYIQRHFCPFTWCYPILLRSIFYITQVGRIVRATTRHWHCCWLLCCLWFVLWYLLLFWTNTYQTHLKQVGAVMQLSVHLLQQIIDSFVNNFRIFLFLLCSGSPANRPQIYVAMFLHKALLDGRNGEKRTCATQGRKAHLCTHYRL